MSPLASLPKLATILRYLHCYIGVRWGGGGHFSLHNLVFFSDRPQWIFAIYIRVICTALFNTSFQNWLCGSTGAPVRKYSMCKQNGTNSFVVLKQPLIFFWNDWGSPENISQLKRHRVQLVSCRQRSCRCCKSKGASATAFLCVTFLVSSQILYF